MPHRHEIGKCYDSYRELLADPEVEVVDIAVPPDVSLDVIREVVQQADHVRGVLRKSRWGSNYQQAVEIVELCSTPASRWPSIRTCATTSRFAACKTLLDRGELGESVLATIDMRAIPHWMPWQQRRAG